MRLETRVDTPQRNLPTRNGFRYQGKERTCSSQPLNRLARSSKLTKRHIRPHPNKHDTTGNTSSLLPLTNDGPMVTTFGGPPSRFYLMVRMDSALVSFLRTQWSPKVVFWNQRGYNDVNRQAATKTFIAIDVRVDEQRPVT